MAFYDYRCPKCEKVKTVRHGMNEKHTEYCECGSTMNKLMGATPTIFKTGGFYATRPLDEGENKD